MIVLLNPELDLTNSLPQALDRALKFRTHVAVHEANSKWCKSLHVLVELWIREASVSFQNVDDDRTPGLDVPLLGFLV